MSASGQTRTVRLNRLSIPAGSGWARLHWIGLAVGVAGVAASYLLGTGDPEQFHFSWLVSFLYFLSLGLGAMFFVLVHHATKAGWGIVVRRLAENVMATIPLFVVLFVPIYLGLEHLFHWSHADAVEHDALLAGKQPFLNSGFFLTRAAVYFVCWTLIALAFRRGSVRQDRNGGEALSRRMVAFSGPGLIVFALTLTFAAFDWIMSLDAHWYSTMFGVYYFAGCLVGIFALMVILAAALSRAGYLEGVVTVEHFHDLGKLLFGFCVFWSYIAFSQYMLIWYANIPEETAFYLHRSAGSWKSMSMFLAWGHFAVPFFFLMPRTIKRKTPLLVLGALWMLFMHLVDLHWLIMPNLHHYDIHLSWLDLSTLLGVGGLFFAVLGWLMQRQALVPVGDPRLAESLSFENF